MLGIFYNRTRICWTLITERIFLLQSVISLRHPGIRSKTKFDISVDDEARRGCEERVGEGGKAIIPTSVRSNSSAGISSGIASDLTVLSG